MSQLDPAFDRAVAVHRAGDLEGAMRMYREMLEADPQYFKAWHLLGVALHQSGQHAAGIEHIQRAIALCNSNAVYFGNLGLIYRSLGRPLDAIPVLQRAVELNPQFIDARCSLGGSFAEICRAPEAIQQFQEVLRQKPNHAEALVGLAYVMSELGNAKGAAELYRQACNIRPHAAWRVLEATQLPHVYASQEDLLAWRQRLTNKVDQLLAEGVKVDLNADAATPVFCLAHQGLNDLDIQRKLARLYHVDAAGENRQCPTEAQGKIHVGFISSYFRDHTIGKLLRGIIAGLDRSEFFVTVLSVGYHDDPTARFIHENCDRYLPLRSDLVSARRAAAEAGCDILFYADIGMDHITYSLSHSRLAPVQCVTWGHPVTTGLDTMDYFVSSKLIEPADAASHYSERLVLLDTMPFYYYRPELPSTFLGRDHFGLAAAAHLYACPQSIYKFHPDFDEVLAGILRRDPLGQLVLISWIYPEVDEQLLARWRRTMPDVLDRVRFVKRMSQDEFMNLLAVCDVLLDPLHFGGGNTSYEGFALGKPIVTLPGAFMRGRLTAGMYLQMGLADYISSSSDQYIETAVRLGTDAVFHHNWSERVLSAGEVLYEDARAIRAIEGFLRQAWSEHTST